MNGGHPFRNGGAAARGVHGEGVAWPRRGGAAVGLFGQARRHGCCCRCCRCRRDDHRRHHHHLHHRRHLSCHRSPHDAARTAPRRMLAVSAAAAAGATPEPPNPLTAGASVGSTVPAATVSTDPRRRRPRRVRRVRVDGRPGRCRGHGGGARGGLRGRGVTKVSHVDRWESGRAVGCRKPREGEEPHREARLWRWRLRRAIGRLNAASKASASTSVPWRQRRRLQARGRPVPCLTHLPPPFCSVARSPPPPPPLGVPCSAHAQRMQRRVGRGGRRTPGGDDHLDCHPARRAARWPPGHGHALCPTNSGSHRCSWGRRGAGGSGGTQPAVGAVPVGGGPQPEKSNRPAPRTRKAAAGAPPCPSGMAWRACLHAQFAARGAARAGIGARGGRDIEAGPACQPAPLPTG